MASLDPEDELDVILLDFPACFNVVPPSFLTSGTFSFILVLRVPISDHVFVENSDAGDSEAVGSMKICRGVLEPDRAPDGGVDVLLRDEFKRVDEVPVLEVDANTALDGAVGTAGGFAATSIPDIIRFWKSSCLPFRCSRGDALLAIPRL